MLTQKTIFLTFLWLPLPFLEATPATPAPAMAAGTATHAPQNSSCVLSDILLMERKKIPTNTKMNKFDINRFREVPVCVLLAVTLITVFSLYVSNLVRSIPCGKKGVSVFLSNFVHIDPYHLAANLFALYSLSRIEISLGWKQFVGLLLFILACNTLVEVMLHAYCPSMPCSIGFSGVLFGMMAWELVATKKLDLMLLLSILLVVVCPSLTNKKASLQGHLIGALSGIFAGVIWKWL